MVPKQEGIVEFNRRIKQLSLIFTIPNCEINLLMHSFLLSTREKQHLKRGGNKML